MRLKKWESSSLFLMMAGLAIAMMTIGLSVIWTVNEEKLGGSLAELIQGIHDKGLQFGLWVEPEMISVDSDLYRAHPDWAIQVPGYEHTYSRNQLVLDFANKEVVAYIKQVLDRLTWKS